MNIIITKQVVIDNQLTYINKFVILYTLGLYKKYNKITDTKYKGQIASLRVGALSKYKKTYHSDLNDKWYNDQTSKEVFLDILDDFQGKESFLTAEELVKVIMDWKGCNYNMGINLFVSLFFEPMLNNWYADNRSFSDRYKIELPFATKAELRGYTCYECGSSHSEEPNKKPVEENILNYFHNQKKGNLHKIPKTISMKGYGSWF